MRFGERLKHYRLENRMSQQDLALQLNVTSQAVSKWENNISEPEFKIIQRLTEVFKITYDQLFLYVEGGTYKGLLIKVKKDQSIGKWYNFITVFLAVLSVSLIFVTSFTFANQNLTWHFPLMFGLSSVFVLFLYCVVANQRFNYKKNPEVFLEIYGDRIKSLIDDTIIAMENVNKVEVVKYKISEKIGKICIQYSEHNKLIVRDVRNPGDIKSLFSEIAYAKKIR